MSVQVPKGYKQTEVGVIPDDWNVLRLKEISPSQSVGLVINPSTYVENNGVVPMLVGSNIEPNKINWIDARKISVQSNDSLPASRLRSGDIVVVRVGEPGISAVIPPEIDGCNCASVMIVRRHERFNSSWLSYLFNSPIGLQQIENVQYGTAQKQFNISDAVNFVYPYPSLVEQNSIAEALSDADALIESLEQLIAKKRQIKQGAMQELLTGQRRLPGFAGEWETVTFNDLVGLRKKRFNPQIDGEHDFCIELEHINQSEGTLNGFTSVKEQSSLKTNFYKDDILFGKLRAYLKKYWKANCDGVCSTEIWVFFAKKDKIIPDFLIQIVQMDKFVEAASSSYGTHMPRSDWNVVKKNPMTIPNIKEQLAISEILGDMDREIFSLNQHLDKVRQIKQAMMQELLTGRIRLI